MKLAKKWAEAYAPYARALRKLKLPRKYKSPDLRNIKRVQAVAETLHAVKEALRAKEKA